MSDLRHATTLWHASVREESFDSLISGLVAADHDDLAKCAANTVLNDWCSDVADYGHRDTDPHGHGKRLPYIGWYWRSVDFARGDITVGDCGEFIGFMENNKWDHPERRLTAAESEHVIGLLWKARLEGGKGGVVSELHAARDAVIGELWDWMQDLTGLTGWSE